MENTGGSTPSAPTNIKKKMIKTYPELDITIHNERSDYIDREWLCILTKYDASNFIQTQPNIFR